MRAIDRLKAAANLKPMKKVIPLSDGTDFVLYHAPLTMAERERAQKDAKSDDAGAFALQLIVNCAKDENGERMFTVADLPELKREVRDEDVQKIIGAILSNEPDEAPATAEAKSPAVGKGTAV
jgi:hypothetical protein